ncbi:MAG: phospholipid carrier-dependent glycosyltransferase [Desertifilum sp.]|nr:phospholipid carrier-dependent glycosyltransferase [Desertifilum sp.]
MSEQPKLNRYRNFLILGLIWLLGAIADRVWYALDNSVPAWDQADYLTGALNYWQLLQTPQWFSGDWWYTFWTRSPKIPPVAYVSATPFIHLFGAEPDQAIIVQFFYSAILLASVYGLGTLLFTPAVGLWAAGLCELLPGLYYYRLDFLLDYPLTAVITLSFLCLTLWYLSWREPHSKQWLWAILFGVCFALSLLLKQTALFFLLVPFVWIGVEALRKRQWSKVGQWLLSGSITFVLAYPWYRLNWLLILTSGKRATIDSAIAEGDPPLYTLEAWTYYGKILPYLTSWPLLLIPIVGLIFYWWKYHRVVAFPQTRIRTSLGWLAIFVLGAYLLCSFNINKDDRYVLPYLPAISLVLAYGLLSWDKVTRQWGKVIRWGTVSLGIVLMVLNLYPIGGTALTGLLSPYTQRYAYLGEPWPHPEVIDRIIQTEPNLRVNLGVLPSTPTLNQHNFNYYGALRNFQVYGRQVGVRDSEILQDARSLSWFLTKTGDQGSVPQPAQANITQIVEQAGDFQPVQSWPLMDGSTLTLHHQQFPPVQVQPLNEPRNAVQLEEVIVPPATPPGVPVPVTYRWTGPGEQLQSGLVLLTWRSHSANPSQRWIHDRAIALGNLQLSLGDSSAYQVVEQLSMLPPADLAPGEYTLEATYLNRETGESYALSVPPVRLSLDPNAPPTPARELDLLTQLRNLAQNLPQGMAGLEPVFAEVARINQYDPTQDYLIQAEKTLAYRLQQEPDNLEWAYTLALSRVLQRKVEDAIAALSTVRQLDTQNPYAHAYLAFVYLYDWRPREAQPILENAIALNPSIPEIQALNGVASLMQGNLLGAWQDLKGFLFAA